MKDCAKDFNEVLILLELWFQLVLTHLEESNIGKVDVRFSLGYRRIDIFGKHILLEHTAWCIDSLVIAIMSHIHGSFVQIVNCLLAIKEHQKAQ